MKTSDKETGKQPPFPRKKGGGDGNAKNARPKSQSAKRSDETSSSESVSEANVRSRKIISSRT